MLWCNPYTQEFYFLKNPKISSLVVLQSSFEQFWVDFVALAMVEHAQTLAKNLKTHNS
jgi:hypothetical protein